MPHRRGPSTSSSAPALSRPALALAVSLVLCEPAFGQSSRLPERSPWPQFLGAGSDLTVDAPGLSSLRGVPRVEVRWRGPLGPGYSQPVVSGQVAYVAFSDGANDRLTALSLASGETLWDYDIGETWRGVDGSDDGPISTPTLGDGVIVALGPRGQLFTLDSATGAELWRVDLPAEHGANPGNYGVATSPLLVDGLVIVQMGGGQGKSVAAFDVLSGGLVWSAGDDAVAYQSPLVAELLGARQLLAVTSTEVYGLDLSDGSLLWRATYLTDGQNHSNPLVVTGPDGFVVTGVNEAVAFRLERDGEGYVAREQWRSRELKRSYSVPVALDGTLYGWSGDFFASVDAETGRRNWKTRGVGPGSLLSLGDWLAIWTVDGRLLFIEPTPTEYRQVAEYQLADAGTLVNPAWTGDGLLLRGRDELLSVAVEVGPPTTVEITGTASASAAPTGRIAKLQVSLAAASDSAERARVIESFLDDNEVPLIEADGAVSFLYYGEAEDVGLVPGGAPVESALPMVRFEGSDLWIRTEQLNRRGAYVYRFELDGERSVIDPRNERRAANFMPSSLLVMPDYRPAPALAPDAAAPLEKGEMTDHTFRSEVMDNERTIAVYTPAGYDDARIYPLVLVTNGIDRIFGRMPRILDATMGNTVESAVVVFVDIAEPANENVFYESLGSRGPLFERMIVEELLPWIEENYSVSSARDRRLMMATLLQGGRALAIALRYPQHFGAVAVQSPIINGALERELTRLLEKVVSSPYIYIDWCERDAVSLAEATAVSPAIERLLPKLRAAGVRVTAQELPGGYGWEMFSTQTEAILARFLALPEDAL